MSSNKTGSAPPTNPDLVEGGGDEESQVEYREPAANMGPPPEDTEQVARPRRTLASEQSSTSPATGGSSSNIVHGSARADNKNVKPTMADLKRQSGNRITHVENDLPLDLTKQKERRKRQKSGDIDL